MSLINAFFAAIEATFVLFLISVIACHDLYGQPLQLYDYAETDYFAFLLFGINREPFGFWRLIRKFTLVTLINHCLPPLFCQIRHVSDYILNLPLINKSRKCQSVESIHPKQKKKQKKIRGKTHDQSLARAL